MLMLLRSPQRSHHCRNQEWLFSRAAKRSTRGWKSSSWQIREELGRSGSLLPSLPGDGDGDDDDEDGVDDDDDDGDDDDDDDDYGDDDDDDDDDGVDDENQRK